MEALWLLRRLRAAKVHMQEDMIALEERVQGGHNGDLSQAHHIIDAEVAICDGIIRKLWHCTGVDPYNNGKTLPVPAKKK